MASRLVLFLFLVAFASLAPADEKTPDLSLFTPEETKAINEFMNAPPENRKQLKESVIALDPRTAYVKLFMNALDAMAQEKQKQENAKMARTDGKVTVAAEAFDPTSSDAVTVFERLSLVQKEKVLALALKWDGKRLSDEKKKRVTVANVEKFLRRLTPEQKKAFSSLGEGQAAVLTPQQKKEVIRALEAK